MRIRLAMWPAPMRACAPALKSAQPPILAMLFYGLIRTGQSLRSVMWQRCEWKAPIANLDILLATIRLFQSALTGLKKAMQSKFKKRFKEYRTVWR